MRVTIRLFARLRDLVGAGELVREMPDEATVASVWDLLLREHASIAPYQQSMSCAVNADFARMNTPLHDGDEVAFLPPVSGG